MEPTPVDSPPANPATPAAAGPPLGRVLMLAAQAWSGFQAGQSLDRALDGALETSRGASAALAGALRDVTTTAVRRFAVTEFLLTRLAHRPPDPEVRALFAVSVAQLLAGAYPDFTLVDQAVRAARARETTAAAAGFLNALLREFLRRREELVREAEQDPARHGNVPPWWLARLHREYGARRTREILAAQNEEPPLVLRVNVRRTTVAGYLDRLAAEGLAASRAGESGVWLHRALPVERIPGFSDGWVSVQDAGAQLAAPLLGVAPGMRVLDACAAPGGKTAHLLELGDCAVDAVERDPERARRIDANLQRLALAGPQARVLVADARNPARFWDGRPYDRILLDAPCTASGIVRRHPDIVWLRRPGDVAKLATQQAKLLDALWPLLARTGRLLYAVCSIFPEEGREQSSSFVERHPDARIVPLRQGEPGGWQLLPRSAQAAPMEFDYSKQPVFQDGFFYALLEKV